jgi:hypothetical protein
MTARKSSIKNGRTRGVSPKVGGQAFATLVSFVLAKYAITLDTETSGSLAILFGMAVGALAGPGTVESRS